MNKRSGMTLIEVMIVVALLAGLMVVAAVSFGVIGQTDVAGDALRFSSSVRYAFRMAASNNATLQMKIDFEERSFAVDKLDVEGGISDDVLTGVTLWNKDSIQSSRRVGILDEEDSRFGTIKRENLQDSFISGEDAQLSDGVYFIGLMTSHHDSVQEEGIGTINFFSNGFVERSVIFIGDEAAFNGELGGIVYSVIIHPLTGQSSVTPGRLDLSDRFFEEEEDR